VNEISLRDGRRLVYEEHGAPHGTPIVHCHGAPSSRIEGELFRLNLKMTRSMDERGAERMISRFPEPDKTLLKRPEIIHGFVRCFQEACLNGVDPLSDTRK
jgi:hypothetical protein